MYIQRVKYNPNLRHRRSIRLQGYDYANAGAYFVTVCCQDRECLFGEIENEKMILNEYGNIAHNELSKTAEIRMNVKIGEFVIMPNHVHAIIQITEQIKNGESDNCESDKQGVCNTPLRLLRSPSNTVGAIIRGYKSAVSKQIHKRRGVLHTPNIPPTPNMLPHISIWQRNYWEHVIRNETEYSKIAEYIHDNPVLWGKKCLNKILPQP